jgi:hypothetical protein
LDSVSSQQRGTTPLQKVLPIPYSRLAGRRWIYRSGPDVASAGAVASLGIHVAARLDDLRRLGVLALRHAPEMAAGDPTARSLCVFGAIFWGARLFVQFFIFDAKPFLTRWWITAGYHSLTLAFIYLAAAFAYAAANPSE